MRVKSVHLKNFKRFTDLLISEIPKTSKLIVVVGPNGCGKSSLFDGFLHWYRNSVGFGIRFDEAYYRKETGADFDWTRIVDVQMHGTGKLSKGALYLRTAYRNDPEFNTTHINRLQAPSEEIKVEGLIFNDQTVSDNYQRLVYDTTAAIYDESNDAKTVQALREELIGQVRQSMRYVFGDLLLNNISDPLGSGAFFFEKGAVKSYHYKNLSGGEKAAFDLILDLHVKKKFFPEAIYCIDETETHLHTRVQGLLTKELISIVPDTGQLWVTTHSLGVLRACQELEAENPGSVCVIDFDGVDPDVPTELTPVSLGRVAWNKLLSIAVDDLSPRIAPEVIIVCEGSSIGNRRKDFDAEIYNRIFSQQVAELLFISGGSSEQVAKVGFSLDVTLQHIIPKTKVITLADRDDKSEAEVNDWEQSGNIILSKRNLESFLFADDVLEKLATKAGKAKLAQNVLYVKAEKLAASVERGNPEDDLKSAAGEIYVELKKRLVLQRPGNTVEAFMRDTLAPLITPEMETYKALYSCIVDKITKGGEVNE
ncbi:MAG: AAA family ATPase [Candidatus Dadabacteria bacterium]|nr:AAA family ATPase [Candidatus Dadabacteria bacterium]